MYSVNSLYRCLLSAFYVEGIKDRAVLLGLEESYGPSFKLLANICIMKQKQMRNLLRMRSGKLLKMAGLFLES